MPVNNQTQYKTKKDLVQAVIDLLNINMGLDTVMVRFVLQIPVEYRDRMNQFRNKINQAIKEIDSHYNNTLYPYNGLFSGRRLSLSPQLPFYKNALKLFLDTLTDYSGGSQIFYLANKKHLDSLFENIPYTSLRSLFNQSVFSSFCLSYYSSLIDDKNKTQLTGFELGMLVNMLGYDLQIISPDNGLFLQYKIERPKGAIKIHYIDKTQSYYELSHSQALSALPMYSV